MAARAIESAETTLWGLIDAKKYAAVRTLLQQHKSVARQCAGDQRYSRGNRNLQAAIEPRYPSVQQDSADGQQIGGGWGTGTAVSGPGAAVVWSVSVCSGVPFGFGLRN